MNYINFFAHLLKCVYISMTEAEFKLVFLNRGYMIPSEPLWDSTKGPQVKIE